VGKTWSCLLLAQAAPENVLVRMNVTNVGKLITLYYSVSIMLYEIF